MRGIRIIMDDFCWVWFGDGVGYVFWIVQGNVWELG